MTISLKDVSRLVVFSSGIAALSIGCVADDQNIDPDYRGPFYGGEVAERGSDLPPPIIVDPGDPAQADPVPAVFAAKQISPSNLTITDESIYWTELANNEVLLKWMHVDGGESFQAGTLDSLPFSTVADDAGLYFAASSEQNIVFAPHLGLEAQALHSSITDPLAIQLTEDYAYWTAADGCLLRGAKEGGDAEVVSCGTGSPISLAIADGSAYWATIEGSLYRASLEPEGAADKLTSGQDFTSGIVADQSGVYWVDEDNREVRRYRHASASVSVLAESQYSPAGVAQDRFYLYFTSQGDGAVKRVLKAGGDVTLLADEQENPGQIVVTNDWLYWINEGDGSVMRLLKNYDY